MSKMQLLLLGHFECLLPSGKPVTLAMRKAEVLLAYLALAPGIRHPRERLINLLWSNRGEEQARNSLRQCLSAIRKTLGDAADLTLQVDRTTVSLKADVIDVDALEFERLASVGEPVSFADAAGLYRGEFLEGIAIRDAACQAWLDSERARFKRQYIEILSSFAHSQLATRDFNAAIRSAERLVEQDPLGESAWRLLMRACHENGDRSHALQAFKRCQQIMRDQLDVEPESETLALRDTIASGQTKIETSTPAPTALADPVTPPSLSSEDHSIAVLPFDNLSGDPEQEYFSDGITDSIILNLAMFPGLQVKSRNSSFAFKQQIKSVGEICDELKVDYIVEGSIRRSQDRIRVTVQLIESTAGNQIWGKRFDADLSNLFELEEELSRSIAATVTGQIDSDLQRIALTKGAVDQRAYDLLLSGTYHANRLNADDNKIAIEKFNQCLSQDPDNARAHAMLYACHGMNNLERRTADCRESVRFARKHIKRALELGPELGIVQTFYAEHLIYNGKFQAAMNHLDKALEINPNDPVAFIVKSIGLVLQDEFEAALAASERARQLDPYLPWVEWFHASAQYFTGRYEAVLETLAMSRASLQFTQLLVVAAHVKLGQIESARQLMPKFLQQCRETMLSMPQNLGEWYDFSRSSHPFVDPGHNRDLIDCLVQAGLTDEMNSSPEVKNDDGQLAMLTDKPPSIAVLPFENMSGDPDQVYFSDGITSSLILGLGMFHGLKVKSQSSSFAFRNSNKSSTQIASELAADYLIEGSIRKSGHKVRLAVQLVEAETDTQIWGKQYDARLVDVLDLEQELSATIAATISGRIGHRIQQSAVRKPANSLKSYDYLLRGLYHMGKFTKTDMEIAQQQIEKCIELDPDNAEAHMQLGMIHAIFYYENWSQDQQKRLNLAGEHLARALDIAPDNAQVQAYYGEYLMNSGDYDRAEFHASKAIELNPTASEGYTVKADILGASRRYEEALELADQCFRLDPNAVGSGWTAGLVYRITGNYDKAIQTFRSIQHPPTTVLAYIAASMAALGQIDQARNEMRLFHRRAKEEMPNYPGTRLAWREFWKQTAALQYEQDFEELFGQLLLAGLCDELEVDQDDPPSIAVLPFENMSGDPEQAFFSDGITADIIATLSKFRQLRIVARHSTEIYRERKASIAEIAAEQGVRYILEGSVRKSGKRIRVSAELIDSQSGQNCWSERYDRDLDDLFAVQDELTQQIALAMKVQLDDGDMARYRSAGTRNIKAWELTLAAADLQNTYIRENILEARTMVQQAIALDSEYGFAQVILGWSYWQEVYFGWSEGYEANLVEAEKCSQRALRLNPDDADAHSLAGIVYLLCHESDKALEYCRRAIETEPGNTENHALMAFSCIFAGDFEQARLHSQTMRKLCPIMPNWYYLIGGQIDQYDGDLDKAIALFEKGIAVEPESPLCRFYLIHALMQKGERARAQVLADEIRELDPGIRGSGLVRSLSIDPAARNTFRAHLEIFDLL